MVDHLSGMDFKGWNTTQNMGSRKNPWQILPEHAAWLAMHAPSEQYQATCLQHVEAILPRVPCQQSTLSLSWGTQGPYPHIPGLNEDPLFIQWGIDIWGPLISKEASRFLKVPPGQRCGDEALVSVNMGQEGVLTALIFPAQPGFIIGHSLVWFWKSPCFSPLKIHTISYLL